MRNLAVICVLISIAVIFVCGCTGSQNATPTPLPSVTATPTPSPTGTPVPTPVATPSPVSISASGDQSTQDFSLYSGLAIFTMKYDGASRFTVALVDQNNNTVSTAANMIGAYDGSRAEYIPSDGDYHLQVTASGPWSVVITQPRPFNSQGTPASLSGNGPLASDFIYLNTGKVTFDMTHNGMNAFNVELLDQNGRLVQTVTDVIGTYKGSQTLQIGQAGIYLLNIDADGSWNVQVSQ